MFKPVRSLGVFYGARQVGTLALTNDNLCAFEYDAKWLEKGFSVSPLALPLKSGVFTANWAPFEGTFGVFADIMPDGWGRLLLDRLLIKHKINPASLSTLDRLAIVGKSGVGALTFRPANVLDHAKNNSDLEYLEKEAMRVLHDDYKGNIALLAQKNGSSGGARPKVLIKKDNAHWLVKFRNTFDPKNMGEIEYEYSLAAKKAGLIMPPTRLFDGKYFGVKRFDLKGKRRIHMHTAAGILGADFRTPSLDYKNLIDLTRLITGRESECEKMWRQMVFNVLTKNKDDHGKNFSFIYDKEWQLSPAYDLVYSAGFNGEHTTSVLGEGNPKKEDMFALARATALSNRKCVRIYDEVASAALPLLKQLKLRF